MNEFTVFLTEQLTLTFYFNQVVSLDFLILPWVVIEYLYNRFFSQNVNTLMPAWLSMN